MHTADIPSNYFSCFPCFKACVLQDFCTLQSLFSSSILTFGATRVSGSDSAVCKSCTATFANFYLWKHRRPLKSAQGYYLLHWRVGVCVGGLGRGGVGSSGMRCKVGSGWIVEHMRWRYVAFTKGRRRGRFQRCSGWLFGTDTCRGRRTLNWCRCVELIEKQIEFVCTVHTAFETSAALWSVQFRTYAVRDRGWAEV